MERKRWKRRHSERSKRNKEPIFKSAHIYFSLVWSVWRARASACAYTGAGQVFTCFIYLFFFLFVCLHGSNTETQFIWINWWHTSRKSRILIKQNTRTRMLLAHIQVYGGPCSARDGGNNNNNSNDVHTDTVIVATNAMAMGDRRRWQ